MPWFRAEVSCIKRKSARRASFPTTRSRPARRIIAKERLGIENLRFQDLRREAAIRLYGDGYKLEQIAEVTGRLDLNTLLRDIEAPAVSERAEPATLAAKGETEH